MERQPVSNMILRKIGQEGRKRQYLRTAPQSGARSVAYSTPPLGISLGS